MKRIISLSALILSLIVSRSQSGQFIHDSNEFNFFRGKNRCISAPYSSNLNRTLYFVDCIDYMPEGDPDPGYKIQDLGNGKFLVTIVDGNSESYINMRLSTWQFPDYVNWVRTEIFLEGESDVQTVSFNVPERSSGFPIIEVLSYMPGSADDYSHAIRAYSIGSNIVVSSFSAFGNSNSWSVFRITFLYWPSNLEVDYNVQRASWTMKSGRTIYRPFYHAWLAIPTTYWAKDADKMYKQFDSAIKEYVIRGNPNALNAFNPYGLTIPTPWGSIDLDPIDVINAGRYVYNIIKGWFSDGGSHFSIDIGYRSFRPPPRVYLVMEDGNEHSFAELTVCTVDFPFLTNVTENSSEVIAVDYHLYQNYPNPFNPSTTIKFLLSRTDNVTLKVYNTLGEKVTTLTDAEYPAGNHEINWNAENLPGGLYLCRLETGNYTQTVKMTLVK